MRTTMLRKGEKISDHMLKYQELFKADKASFVVAEITASEAFGK